MPEPRPCAVIFDRDGTLVVDVPYNGDPDRVEPVAGARAALDRLRAAGLPLAVVSNQSGIGRGLISVAQVEAVNRRIDELLGPFAVWVYCPHGPDDACDCRKPQPKMLFDAARAMGVEIVCCAIVGDKATDEQAAHNAGAMAVRIMRNGGLDAAVDRILSLRSRA
jgi:D-glycero-D-manno-heptose 1,7-bisphosphate phosphatase